MERKLEEKYDGLKIAERGARISIAAYVLLSIVKLAIGYIASSEALIADGLNNTTDIISSIAVLIGLRIARKPADDNHHYGHFRAETLASLIAASIMILVGLDVLYKALRTVVFMKKTEAPDIIAAVVGIFCAVIIYVVYRYNKKIATKINSSGLMAAAKDNLSDAYVSVGTSVGIIASQFGLPWIDPLAAIIVGFLIVKTGYEIFRDSSYNLTDGFSKDKLNEITVNLNQIAGIKVHNIKARVHGNNVLLDLIVKMDANLSVMESHNVTELIEERLKSEFSITEVIIHVEPLLK